MEHKLCSGCNVENAVDAKYCESCGYSFEGVKEDNSRSSWLALLLLSYFLGYFGIDRFYVGKIGTGILKLITIGGCGIWHLIDLIFICCERFTDKYGKYVVERQMAMKMKLIIIIFLLAFYVVSSILAYDAFDDIFSSYF